MGHQFMGLYKGREVKTETHGFRKKIHGFGPDAHFKFEWTQKDNKKVKISIADYIKQHYNKVTK